MCLIFKTNTRILKLEINTIQLHQNFAKAKSALTTQIRTKNIELANFLYKRRISKVNLSTCFCEHLFFFFNKCMQSKRL